MNKRKYEKKPGDLEVRILRDGRVVFIGPDEKMLSITEALNRQDGSEEKLPEVNINARSTGTETDSTSTGQ